MIKYKCTICHNDYSNIIDEKFKKRFQNTFEFSNNDINTFILLPQKDFILNEYMDEWEKFNETLPEQEEFYSTLNLKDIADGDYMHAKRVCKDIGEI